jgi:serine/threonine protein kinase
MTQTGVVLGTMRYLAPEVAAGEPATERSDLYSAGCVLEEVGGLGALTDALTAEDPAARPASAEAALAELGGDTTTAATAPTAPTAVIPQRPRVDAAAQWHAARRSPWFAPVAALAAIVVLAIVVVALATAGGGDGGTTPQVAPSNAPLEQQLDELDRAIDSAR